MSIQLNFNIEVTSITASTPPPTQNLATLLIDKTLNAMREMMQCQIESKRDGNSTKGVWYPNDYLLCLLKNRQNMPWQSYFGGWYPGTYFTKLQNLVFTLNRGVPPSTALEALLKGPTITDCTSMIQICIYKALYDILGKEKYDAYFSTKGMIIGANPCTNVIHPLHDFLEQVSPDQGSLGYRPIQKGDRCFLQNVATYRLKHTHAEYYGWSVLCVDDTPGSQQYIGFGFERPMTEIEIYRLFIEGYNEDHTLLEKLLIKDAQRSPARYKQGHLLSTEAPEKQVVGFVAEETQRWNIEAVRQLLD